MTFREVKLCVLLALSLTGAANAGGSSAGDAGPTRLAIVIGNSNYTSEDYRTEPTAANDARRISTSLKDLGFEVTTGINLTESAWKSVLADAARRLDSYDALLVYYAGEGFQVNGENYLVPVDAPPVSMESLRRMITLSDMLRALAGHEHQTLIFLDTSRDNPLGPGAKASNSLVAPYDGGNLFLAFATAPGKVVAEGRGPNSPFTTALMKYLTKDNTGTIFDTMLNVMRETDALTDGRQTPWFQSSLVGDFRFNESGAPSLK